MGVRINILPYVRHLTNGQTLVEGKGNTVGECLDNLTKQFPGIEAVLFDDNGELLNYIDVYINGESAYPENLTRLVKEGDELYILPIIDGG